MVQRWMGWIVSGPVKREMRKKLNERWKKLVLENPGTIGAVQIVCVLCNEGSQNRQHCIDLEMMHELKRVQTSSSSLAALGRWTPSSIGIHVVPVEAVSNLAAGVHRSRYKEAPVSTYQVHADLSIRLC
jgi:hypothetical protein